MRRRMRAELIFRSLDEANVGIDAFDKYGFETQLLEDWVDTESTATWVMVWIHTELSDDDFFWAVKTLASGVGADVVEAGYPVGVRQ
jgi:hypothetical protein